MSANARRLAFLLLGLGLAAIGQSYFDRKIQFYDALWLVGLGLGLAVLLGLRQVAGEQRSGEMRSTSAPLHLCTAAQSPSSSQPSPSASSLWPT